MDRRNFRSKITNPNFQMNNRNQNQNQAGGNSAKTILLKLKQARTTGVINISNLRLSEIPPEVFDPNVNIPDLNWWEMIDITRLDASNNNLSENSFDNETHNLANLSYLVELRFAHNNFSFLPDTLYSLSNLKLLDVSDNKISFLNAELLKSLCSLVELDLSKNELREIPEQIQFLTYLEILRVSDNKIVNLPRGLAALRRLKKLNIENNSIQYLPPEIFANMSLLEELYAFKNRIELVSNSNCSLTDNLKSLKFLDLHSNSLTAISFNVELPRLDSVLLSYNQLTKIFGIDKCVNLTNLDVNNNKLESLPIEIMNLKKLSTLNIQNNSINELPNTLGLMNSLVRLSIEGNPLRRLVSKMRTSNTESIKSYLKTRITDQELENSNVIKKDYYDVNMEKKDENILSFITNTTLNMSGNELTEIPIDNFMSYVRKNTLDKIDFSKNKIENIYPIFNIIPAIQSLKELDLSNNKISQFPIFILNLPNLATLNMSKNKISLFPYEQLSEQNIYNLRCNLKYIDLSFNLLEKVPEILGLYAELSTLLLMNNKIVQMDSLSKMQLNKLDTINLGNNQISMIPKNLYKNIPNVRMLILENNNIKDIPTDLCLLKNLNSVNFYGNAIKRIRTDLLNNAKNLVAYLKKMHQPDDEGH